MRRSLSLFSPCLFFSPRRPLSLSFSHSSRVQRSCGLLRFVKSGSFFSLSFTCSRARLTLAELLFLLVICRRPCTCRRVNSRDKVVLTSTNDLCALFFVSGNTFLERGTSLSLSLCISFSAPLRAISYPLLPSRPSTAVRTHWSESFIFRSLTLLSFRKSMRSPPYSLSFSLSFLYSD